MIDTARLWRESPVAAAGRTARRAAERVIPRAALARLADRLWWPFEAGNDLGALGARHADRPYPSYVPDRTGNELVMALRSVQRRVHVQRALILAARTVWLALLVALVVMLARFITPVSNLVVGLMAAGVVALGYLYGRTHRVTIWTTARLLDRHLRLHEQITTAIELAITPAPVRLASHQVAVALTTLRRVREAHRFRPRVPWIELQMALSVGLLVVGLSLLSGPGERLAPPRGLIAPDGLSQTDLAELGITDPTLQAQLTTQQGATADQYANLTPPGLDPSMDLSGADSQALRDAAELSNRSANELQQIAEALKDASVTSQAAQAMQAGDYANAAQQLSDLAKSLENLSPQARADLAERMKQAADNIQAMDPELARRLEQASKALQSRSDRAAAQGLEDLSKAVTDTGKNVLSQQQLAEALARMGDGGATMNDDGPSRAQSNGGSQGQPNADATAAMGEGEAGQNGFGSAESALSLGATAGASTVDDGSGGAGAGQGQGAANDQYQPRLSPNSDRVVVPTDQAPGPTAPRLGKAQPGAPDVITTGPGTTGAGSVPQNGLPITTGLDANRVPRNQRPVVEGYFKAQK